MAKETTETALVVIEPTNALAVFTEPAKMDPILAAIKKIVAEFTPDTTTAKGRDEIRAIAHKVTRSKTYLDGIGKDLVDQYKDIPKKIDANRKRIKDELDALRDEVRKPLTDWEDAERTRVAIIEGRIRGIEGMILVGTELTAAMCEDGIATLTSLAIDESFEEFAAKAQAAKDSTLAKLYAARDAAMKREAEAAELARLRAEAAQREQEERDRKIAEAAAEKARRDAEEKAAREKAEAERKAKEEREAAERRELELKLAAERAERERLQAIERAEREKQAAIEAERRKQEEAERARLAEEAREKAEAERRAADLANRERVHVEIRDMLMSEGLPQTYAAAVVSLLSEGRVPHCVVRY